jgi:hypothetical protein
VRYSILLSTSLVTYQSKKRPTDLMCEILDPPLDLSSDLADAQGRPADLMCDVLDPPLDLSGDLAEAGGVQLT